MHPVVRLLFFVVYIIKNYSDTSHCHRRNGTVSANHSNHYLLRVVVAGSSFCPGQEFPEHNGTSNGNSNDSPPDPHSTVLGVCGRL